MNPAKRLDNRKERIKDTLAIRTQKGQSSFTDNPAETAERAKRAELLAEYVEPLKQNEEMRSYIERLGFDPEELSNEQWAGFEEGFLAERGAVLDHERAMEKQALEQQGALQKAALDKEEEFIKDNNDIYNQQAKEELKKVRDRSYYLGEKISELNHWTKEMNKVVVNPSEHNYLKTYGAINSFRG